MKTLLACLMLICVGCTKDIAAMRPEPAALRSAEGYAIAACILYELQKEQDYLKRPEVQAAIPYLKKQADLWADAIVHTGRLRLDPLAKIAQAVRTEVAKGEMTWGQVDTHIADEVFVALPLRYCADIIRSPAVRTVIDTVLADNTNILPPEDD